MARREVYPWLLRARERFVIPQPTTKEFPGLVDPEATTLSVITNRESTLMTSRSISINNGVETRVENGTTSRYPTISLEMAEPTTTAARIVLDESLPPGSRKVAYTNLSSIVLGQTYFSPILIRDPADPIGSYINQMFYVRSPTGVPNETVGTLVVLAAGLYQISFDSLSSYQGPPGQDALIASIGILRAGVTTQYTFATGNPDNTGLVQISTSTTLNLAVGDRIVPLISNGPNSTFEMRRPSTLTVALSQPPVN